MLFDYHAHTPRCGHATGAMEEYVARAQALGMEEFGFSDHGPWMIQHPGQHLAMEWHELPEYVADVQRLQQQGNREGARPFRLRLGLELDYVPTRADVAQEALAPYPWDYLIGSVHNVGLWGLCNHQEQDLYDRYRLEDICEMYFDAVGRMVSERFCDVIAHLDLPKKYGLRPEGGMLRWVEPLIPEILRAGMTVEVNTSGLDHAAREFYPARDILEALVEAGVPLVVSSDAHAPGQIGRHFGTMIPLLGAMGVTHGMRFEQRRAIPTPLPTIEELQAAGLYPRVGT